MSKQVNPQDMAGDIPAIKFDHDGKLTLLATGGGFVLCRRGDCYPMIRTDREWRALSDTSPVYAAAGPDTHETNGAFSIDPKRCASDQSRRFR